jgi:hypothetical protein
LFPFCFQHITHRAALYSEFSAFLTIISFPVFTQSFNVQPFPFFLKKSTMASADFCGASHASLHLLVPSGGASPSGNSSADLTGKNANFLSIYLANLQLDVSDSLGLCFVLQTHPHPTA